ncbi:hypothetical protein CLV49_1904 [Labedella gwakjiensis]|uniref:Uncharacterized protein n=1 Tax=Labedella gwakjiensis TaxID=390269 RepID=A0A2P8GWE4_9MICO|nr:hypothetical protein [Labedella gwakjiensis]PSL38287.1 hypothetical protein CLV49_1904 [Labedella gwakjiensis]RUQ87175.1 hypothetical protein ELQ93_09700 [Labedella gwakjiensis]
MSRETPEIPVGAGRELGERARGTIDTPIEEVVDVGVISWFPSFGAQADAIRSKLRRAAREAWEERQDALLAERPDARDAVRPASWRASLRVLGFLGGATVVASVLVALGFSKGSTPPLPASTAAVVSGISSVVALLCLGGSLLFPTTMGRPSRLVSGPLWISAIAALGSAAALPLRPATWGSTTPVWWSVTAVTGVALLVLAVVVSVWRRRLAGAAPIDDDDVDTLRLSVVRQELERAVVEVEQAWRRVDPAVRDALLRERDVALATIAERTPGVLDPDWVRSMIPGTMMLPHVADQAHSSLHLGAAQKIDRAAGGPYGYFVGEARERGREPRA